LLTQLQNKGGKGGQGKPTVKTGKPGPQNPGSGGHDCVFGFRVAGKIANGLVGGKAEGFGVKKTSRGRKTSAG